MANHTSKMMAGFRSQPYGPVPTTQDPSSPTAEKPLASQTTTPIHSELKKSSSQSWSAAQILLTAAIPLAALVVWLVCVRANPRIFDTFAGEKIGGHLSQAEAKAVDAITGAVLAPLLMTTLNFVWFGSARVSALNEQQAKPIPLRTLVAASGTTGGNYDLFNLRNLLMGKTWTLGLFALLTMLSAVSRTALSNVIAYEAFSELGSSQTSVPLRLQSDVTINKDYDVYLSGPDIVSFHLYNFDGNQDAQVVKDVVTLLTEISYEASDSKLTNGTYVAMNVTSKSLESLPPAISRLENVPAYRLSVNCTPDLPDQISVYQPLTKYDTMINLNMNKTAWSDNQLFEAFYPGTPDNIQKNEGDGLAYAGFSLSSEEAYLGTLDRFDLSNYTQPSAYGTLHYRAYNMTPWGFSGTKGLMSACGLRCVLYREHGLANASRSADNTSSTAVWTIDAATFPEQKKQIIPSQLSKFQYNSLNFHVPGSSIPGLGPALSSLYAAKAIDVFTDFAHTYLYASGQTQRILYEVAASSKNASLNLPQYTIHVPAYAMQLQYRITYVPGILLVGLICLLGASAVTGTMALAARKSLSARAQRDVNVTRLLLDSVVGLEADADELARVAQSGNDELDAWAAGYKVKYRSTDDDTGDVRIVLEKIKA
ncbi:hypothetical protein GMOD_00009864 [Pyrenophora seminiperda CCB06]|uniref:Uncharacterized protein n=1 Tax=Pyrenophora seminiperda CCB06 TaxID=1302712 RepID=A0A3M7MEM8_9PLEO|nr:hypothetical protein GMOD_00009864 [Pyrenophora seminiperda CCB06]